ncbi:hypothetical protein [Bacillus wiedmannii]|uniref:hypothetical protein n=1 Tax=Bacillus wiedmannii TaxID=1890302 RepID=UPI000BF38E6F|nr:hypothetical protein [Bacillus wiedmannii]PFZ66858.1 hypothetical protein COL76_04820 [Bacillus wiedmannii]
MRNYFVVVSCYEQNSELFEVNYWFEVEDDVQKAMVVYTETTRKAYEKAMAITKGELISVTSREVSEFEYKRHALTEEGKRELNMQKRGRN